MSPCILCTTPDECAKYDCARHRATVDELHIPEGYYLRTDADGEHIVRKPDAPGQFPSLIMQTVPPGDYGTGCDEFPL